MAVLCNVHRDEAKSPEPVKVEDLMIFKSRTPVRGTSAAPQSDWREQRAKWKAYTKAAVDRAATGGPPVEKLSVEEIWQLSKDQA